MFVIPTIIGCGICAGSWFFGVSCAAVCAFVGFCIVVPIVCVLSVIFVGAPIAFIGFITAAFALCCINLPIIAFITFCLSVL